jgi:hypothetical protein
MVSAVLNNSSIGLVAQFIVLFKFEMKQGVAARLE